MAQQGRYVENKGQFHVNAKFRAILPYGKLFLENNRMTYLFHKEKEYNELWQHPRVTFKDTLLLTSHAFRVNFVAANRNPIIKTPKKAEGYHNYYIGKDPSKWASKVGTHHELLYKEVYPNIDLKFYSNGGAIKYDWIVKEGGDIENIVMEYEGVDSLKIKGEKLLIYTAVNVVEETIPLCYSGGEESRMQVACKYIIEGNKVRFDLEDNGARPMVIDPRLIFSTYSGSYGDNFGFTATYDSRGNLYAGGITNGDDQNGGYPVTNGVFQDTFTGGEGRSPANLPCDITISKYDSSGTKLLFATYLGGGRDDYPHSLVVNNKDELIVFGTSFSKDYPTSVNAYDKTANGTGVNTDVIVSKISKDGSVLMGSTFVGGGRNDGLTTNSNLMYNYSDDYRGDVIPDNNGNIFVATCSQSRDFPVVSGAAKGTKIGLEGVVFQLNSDLSQLLWSTYVGGDGDDAFYSVKLDEKENIYVAGGTESTDLPSDTAALQDSLAGQTDGFVAKFNALDKSLNRLTYWGTPAKDQIYFIQLDQRGNLFANGQTEGNVTPSPNTYNIPNTGQFIIKLDTVLSKVKLQTVVGARVNNPDISPSAFLVDNCDNIYLSGWGSVVHPQRHAGSTTGLPVTPGAIQTTTDGEDFYLMVLRKDMDSLLYATYFGGDLSSDHVDGGTSRFDKRGVVYQSVCSSCPNFGGQHFSDFPISTGAAFDTNYSSRCSNAAFKLDLQFNSAVIASFDPNPKIGCNPLTVTINNTSIGGVRYEWDFGDGTKDTVKNPVHIYGKAGVFEIKLKVIDSMACNKFDEAIRTIEVVDSTHSDFEVSFNPCNKEFSLNNTSQKADSFYWDFGNGETSKEKDPRFEYKGFGTFTITLITNPNTLCADTSVRTVDIKDLNLSKYTWGNVITPNNDGKNDCFRVDGLEEECNTLEMKILNRWGQLLYETRGIDACWNGRKSQTEEEMPDGTYYYILKIETRGGDTINTNGVITLIR